MKSVLVVAAHDSMVDSVMTKAILADIAKKMPEAVIDDLDVLNPNQDFDIKAEQAKLEAADIIVLQFPFYWYSMPGMMHRWMEFVFAHGWSHGSTGNALEGKTLLVSFTTGAPDFAYSKEGPMQHDLADFMAPFESTCILTKMKYGGFVATCGVSYGDRKPENMSTLQAKAEAHVDKLLATIAKL